MKHSIFILILISIINCKANYNQVRNYDKNINRKQNLNTEIISQWISLLKKKLTNYSKESMIKVDNCTYENLKNLYWVRLNDDKSKHYFFDKNENCVMISINTKSYFNKLSHQEIVKILGTPEGILRSRAGKQAHHYVYAKKGFAFSELNGQIIDFEIFPSSDLETYKKEIHTEVGLYTK